MSPVLDEKGREIPEHREVCPDCGSLEKDHEIFRGLGGWWKKLCNLCGHKFAEGRDVPGGE